MFKIFKGTGETMKIRLRFHKLLVLAFSVFLLLIIAQTTFSQTKYKCLGKNLSLDNILNVLQGTSIDSTLSERNDYATNCVKKDGVSFIVTSGDEVKLKAAGANNILIDAIRIEGGISPLQNQKPYSPESTWSLSPRLPGKWELLNLQDSQFMTDQLLKETPSKLANTIRQVKKFRTMLLPFYPGAELVEGLVPNTGILTFIVLRDGDITLLNGTSPPIHELNAQVPILIDSQENAELYLKFFCFQVFGEEGDFRLIEVDNEIAWMKSVTPADKQRVIKKIKPLKLDKSGDELWKAEATVQYSDALFRAIFSIKKTGMVEMLEDTPLEVDLPIRGEFFNGYLRVEFDGKNISKSSLEDDYIKRAEEAFNKGDYKSAIVLYSEAIKANSQNPDLFMKRGFSHHYYGDWETAVADYGQAVKLKPDLGSNALLKCLPYTAGDKNVETASSVCNQAMKDFPQFSLLYYKRALINFTKSDYRASYADLYEATKLNPNFVGAYRNLGSFYFSQKKYDEAIKEYSRAIELRKDFVNVYVSRGNSYYEKSLSEPLRIRIKDTSSYNLCFKDFAKAIELSPKTAYIYMTRGDIYVREKDYNKAVTDYTEVINLAPNFAETYIKRGESYENQRKYDLAIADYSKVLQLEPDNKLAKDKLEVVRKKNR